MNTVRSIFRIRNKQEANSKLDRLRYLNVGKSHDLKYYNNYCGHIQFCYAEVMFHINLLKSCR